MYDNASMTITSSPSSSELPQKYRSIIQLRKMRILGIDFVPLNEPLEMRFQTLVVGIWIMLVVCSNLILSIITLLLILHTSIVRWFVIAYLGWMVFLDWDTCERGDWSNRISRWLRNVTLWHYFRAYFPVKLVKTAELDPARNYLLCCFPHGILSIGVTCTFGTDVMQFNKMYPGIRSTLLTLAQNFKYPLAREMAYNFGLCSADEKSIKHILSTPGGGRAAALVVGGVEEAFYSKPGVYRVILRRKTGFIRIALELGTPIVPVLAFGEPDLYDQLDNPEGSLLRRFQTFSKKMMGYALIIPIGRGLFQNSFGILPRRKPITVVVGSPMELPKIDNPTMDNVIEYRTKFEEALTDLFEVQKYNYLQDPENKELIIS